MLPAILVSTQPRYQASSEWFATRVIEVLQASFGDNALRLCEACMAPRAWVEDGFMAYQTGAVGIDEVIRLDEQTRGSSRPARTAIWVDESMYGVSVRIVDLRNGSVLLAQNFDPNMVEKRRTHKTYSLAAEYERRATRGSLTQGFVDIALYPNQHISFDWTDQWGKTNANMSGLSLSMVDPILGIGAAHYRRVELWNILIGGKFLLSFPTAVVNAISPDDVGLDELEPIVNLVGVVRVPFGRSNYGAVLTVSTNGRLALGISLMNISLLPVIP